MQRFLLFTVFIMTLTGSAYAGQNTLTAEIYDDQSDDKVMLTFDASKGGTFTKVEFQYSTDSIQFTTIHRFDYKKDNNAIAHISYLHEIKYIGKVYYRVVTDGESVPETICFDLGKLYGAVKVMPNPVKTDAVIHFNNKFGYSCSVKMANSLGYEILSLAHFTGNRVDVDASALKPGLYHFAISSDNGKLFFSGTMLVSH